MDAARIEDILLIGNFMKLNVFPFQLQKDPKPWTVYIADDEYGHFDWEGINYYNPDTDWNHLMPVCKRINGLYFDNRQNIYAGLQNMDIEATFRAVVEFIKFWNDDSQPKRVWNESPPEGREKYRRSNM